MAGRDDDTGRPGSAGRGIAEKVEREKDQKDKDAGHSLIDLGRQRKHQRAGADKHDPNESHP
jgi:hypothetical protein